MGEGNLCQNCYIRGQKSFEIAHFISHFGNFLAQIAFFCYGSLLWHKYIHFFVPRFYLPTYTHGPPITISQVFSSHSIKVVPCSFYIQFHTTHLFRWTKMFLTIYVHTYLPTCMKIFICLLWSKLPIVD